MKNGLAMWHYPHRSLEENVKFFLNYDFDAISFNILQIVESDMSEDCGDAVAKLLRENNIFVTVHGGLPVSHKKEDEDYFRNNISHIAKWQKNHNLISILSFDVPDAIRDNMSPYLDYVLESVPGCRVAVEDFGLNENELSQIEYLKSNERFGYLLDIGHMFIRLTGNPAENATLFQKSRLEGEPNSKPDLEGFLSAFKSKTFPVFEIHLHNNDGMYDSHMFLEDGKLDIKIIAKLLKEINYNGIVTIESAPGFRFDCFGKDADEGIIRTLEYWQKIYK